MIVPVYPSKKTRPEKVSQIRVQVHMTGRRLIIIRIIIIIPAPARTRILETPIPACIDMVKFGKSGNLEREREIED